MAKTSITAKQIEAIDLFCGAGGLSRGLSDSGLKVVAGVDVDRDCLPLLTTTSLTLFVATFRKSIATIW